jgi:hypothetical protein
VFSISKLPQNSKLDESLLPMLLPLRNKQQLFCLLYLFYIYIQHLKLEEVMYIMGKKQCKYLALDFHNELAFIFLSLNLCYFHIIGEPFVK